ncbi:MAG: hypothetical protein H6621_07475 [Halobacteriovoraceae bacterium]|nr:hypothetical protein [Halobacteriovoraceae bacterium]
MVVGKKLLLVGVFILSFFSCGNNQRSARGIANVQDPLAGYESRQTSKSGLWLSPDNQYLIEVSLSDLPAGTSLEEIISENKIKAEILFDQIEKKVVYHLEAPSEIKKYTKIQDSFQLKLKSSSGKYIYQIDLGFQVVDAGVTPDTIVNEVSLTKELNYDNNHTFTELLSNFPSEIQNLNIEAKSWSNRVAWVDEMKGEFTYSLVDLTGIQKGKPFKDQITIKLQDAATAKDYVYQFNLTLTVKDEAEGRVYNKTISTEQMLLSGENNYKIEIELEDLLRNSEPIGALQYNKTGRMVQFVSDESKLVFTITDTSLFVNSQNYSENITGSFRDAKSNIYNYTITLNYLFTDIMDVDEKTPIVVKTYFNNVKKEVRIELPEMPEIYNGTMVVDFDNNPQANIRLEGSQLVYELMNVSGLASMTTYTESFKFRFITEDLLISYPILIEFVYNPQVEKLTKKATISYPVDQRDWDNGYYDDYFDIRFLTAEDIGLNSGDQIRNAVLTGFSQDVMIKAVNQNGINFEFLVVSGDYDVDVEAWDPITQKVYTIDLTIEVDVIIIPDN